MASAHGILNHSIPPVRHLAVRQQLPTTSCKESSSHFVQLSVPRGLSTVLRSKNIVERSSIGSCGVSMRTASKSGLYRHRAVTRAAVATDHEELEEWSLPPNELPEGKWQRMLVQAERTFNETATNLVIKVLDTFYNERPYARFYVLETIARVPYFGFMSVLHMYESFGWWRRADYLKVHFAESWNELHHLLIMEALGGDRRWFDRFLAQHISVAYFFATTAMYTLNPRMAYHFSECVEKHAFATYDKFLRAHGEELKLLPPPEVAVRYYTEGDLYMFDEFQTAGRVEKRRPRVDTLYDVFCAIREDEAEHCKTMRACQTPSALHSPHRDFVATAPSCSNTDRQLDNLQVQVILPPAECAGIIECAITSKSYAERMEHTAEIVITTEKASS